MRENVRIIRKRAQQRRIRKIHRPAGESKARNKYSKYYQTQIQSGSKNIPIRNESHAFTFRDIDVMVNSTFMRFVQDIYNIFTIRI